MNEEIFSVMEQLKMFEYSSETIDIVTHGEIGEPDTAMENSINSATEDPSVITKLYDLLQKLTESNKEQEFWDQLTEEGRSPNIFQVFCAAMITQDGELRKNGAVLYAKMLTMIPIQNLWNPILFNTLLTIMMNASQIVEAGKAASDSEKETLLLSVTLLKILTKSICPQFIECAQIDGLIALTELSFKLSCAYTEEFDDFSRMMIPVSKDFLETASVNYLEYILPYLVNTLLLEFLPSNRKVTQRVSKIRDVFLTYAKDKLETHPSMLLLVIKHLLLRSTERATIRENCCYCVHFLYSYLHDKDPLYKFLTAMIRSPKSAYRTLALDITRTFLEAQETIEKMSPETIVSLTRTLFMGVNDSVAGVRATTLDTIASIIGMLPSMPNRDEVETSIGLPDTLLEKLERRVVDEKLVVRKASLRCIKAILPLMQRDPYTVIKLIADRTRDHSISLRQEAAKILTTCINGMKTIRAYSIWFDSLLPLCMDVDSKTQLLALSLVDKNYLSILGTEDGITMTESLDPIHMDLMSRVIPVYKQCSTNLQPFCRGVQKLLSSNINVNIWNIACYLMSETPEHFNTKKLEDLWSERENLPVEYYRLISLSKTNEKTILNDSLELLNSVAANDKSITEPEDVFNWIHSLVNICRNISEDISAKFTSLLQQLNERINKFAEDPNTRTDELEQITTGLFLMGEIMKDVPSIMNFDFTGCQLLISEHLPNETIISSRVRAIATITLGKLCLVRRDISSSFVAAFAKQLRSSDAPAVKCNCLIVLCDLCVKYTSTVDPYVQEMTLCFVDKYPIVRRQSLLILTRLITEEFIKMRPLMFFRFISALTDANREVSKFAKSCLFDVLHRKIPKLLVQNFIDSLFYFNDMIEPSTINENPDFHNSFKISDAKTRRKAFCNLISHMPDDQLFDIINNLGAKVLQKFIDEQIKLEDGENLLSDTIFCMIKIEDQMEAINVNEASIDDPAGVAVMEQSRKFMEIFHNQLIDKILPTLNEMNKLLRRKNSPMQSELRIFFRKLCEKNADLIEELKTKEPILAAEIEHDLIASRSPLIQQQEEEESLSPSPQQTPLMPFKSPLLSRIINTPRMSLVTASANASPMSVVPQRALLDPTQKRTPIPFNLDEDE
ncbi:hypothetical protein TVAG_122920 [Trichomonas vaginalis G3]|uniref:Condensin complex subunit 1 C-terminal domain-containing protein n=1 Tax=Trichomonas vaginalis (strain ATCC PRA-98 / G3) TaxID=412133 RepID=A2DN49_TRIV3|nr:condensin family [Trichomonas vaginalis G3]EAY18226.1 hypothetical protein TVAG_122920 [Trichomonas vaginalis G3]KAI5491531.1 condensin family [Trichomonas vaginalis G3]|eukprot:XP_001579212.1 hypothetical protein [Trichomonas vaginalis G3]